MELSEELARTYVTVKRAADPREIRDQFEALAREEEGLRERAGRWENTAVRRAAREEGGLGGYASTAIGRTLGLPRSLGELLFRGGGAGLGAYAGGRVGKELGSRYARIPSESIAPLFTQTMDKGEMKPTAIQRRLFGSIEPGINTAADAIHVQVLRDAYPGLEDILKREGRSLRSFVEDINDPEAHTTQTSQQAKRTADAFRTRRKHASIGFSVTCPRWIQRLFPARYQKTHWRACHESNRRERPLLHVWVNPLLKTFQALKVLTLTRFVSG